ncbi:MAG: hypothetical protein EAZ36_03880, partial [Verrucomicrobia bacterium]
LADFLARLAHDFDTQGWRNGAVALVLAGGYGRGEGGVFRVAEGAAAELYNDLEFFLFLKPEADAGAAARWCEGWEKAGTAELGIDVEFKRDAAGVLCDGAPTMFWHDLLQGHRVVWGDAGLLAGAPARLRDPAGLPASEATRLLFNRGSGLWFARLKLDGGRAEDGGFVQRNHQKARLALGDAVLALAGRHHGLCEERARRIAAGGFDTPPGWARIVAWHAGGVAFKLRPRHRAAGRNELAEAQAALTAAWLEVFLWVEGRRLGKTFRGASDYAEFRGRLFPETPVWRNVALHARDRLKRGEALPGWTDYPRAALQRALVAALAGGAEAGARRIGVADTAYPAAYARWWARYN